MFTLPDLPYGYDALEPYIDKETMQIHHDKHHGIYVEKLNEALKNFKELLDLPIEKLLNQVESVPSDVRQAVINHGGGHANHSFFWNNMKPGGSLPQGELNDAIRGTFGTIESFKEKFNEKALGVFGSGWAFLIMTPGKKLKLKRQSFQNSPLMRGNIPILGIDVWEHAYYLKYQNRRKEYVDAWWNVVNWEIASDLFAKGKLATGR